MRAYITRYALSKGIFEIECRHGTTSEMVVAINSQSNVYYHKPDWHTDLDAAITRAEDMRANKIASLEKQISKLKSIDFRKQVKLLENEEDV